MKYWSKMEWCFQQSENLTSRWVLVFIFFIVILEVLSLIYGKHLKNSQNALFLRHTSRCCGWVPLYEVFLGSFPFLAIPRQSFSDGIGTYVRVAQVNQGERRRNNAGCYKVFIWMNHYNRIIHNWVYSAYREYNYHLGYTTGGLGYIGDEKVTSYRGITTNHYMEIPIETTSLTHGK